MSVRNLEFLFRPGSIALFGADSAPRSIGRVLAQNLFGGGFDGPVMPVHARDTAVQGVLAYRSVSDLPLTADLAVIASPPAEIPALIAQLGARGTRAAVVISHDFDNPDNADATLAATNARRRQAPSPTHHRAGLPRGDGAGDRPECELRAHEGEAGDLAFVSQSGSLMTRMLDWAAARGIGFSLLASLGDRADVDFGDMLDYLALDADTRAVLLCIDHIAHPRKFVSAARAAARLKPVIVFHARRLDARRQTQRRRRAATEPSAGLRRRLPPRRHAPGGEPRRSGRGRRHRRHRHPRRAAIASRSSPTAAASPRWRATWC